MEERKDIGKHCDRCRKKCCECPTKKSIKLKQCLIVATRDELGNRIYVLKLTVKNKSNKCIEHFFVREDLLTDIVSGSLMEVKIIPKHCDIVPVTPNTPQKFLDQGNIINSRVSQLKPCETVSILYVVKYLNNTEPVFDLSSSVTVGGKCVLAARSKLDLVPGTCCVDSNLGPNSPCTNTTGAPSPGCVRFDDNEVGTPGTKCVTIGTQEICVTVNNWIPATNGSGYKGFTYEVTGGVATCGVVKYGRDTINFITEPTTSGSFDEGSINKNIGNVNFCFDCFPFDVEIAGPNTVCFGESGMFTAVTSTANSFTYQWILDGMLDQNQTGDTFQSPTNLSVGSHTLQVNVIDNCGNVNSSTVEFNVTPLPSIIVIDGPNQVPFGETAQFNAVIDVSTSSFTVNWEIVEGDGIIQSTFGTIANITIESSLVIRATVTDSNGCTSAPIFRPVGVIFN